jgi:hypothetical protein
MSINREWLSVRYWFAGLQRVSFYLLFFGFAGHKLIEQYTRVCLLFPGGFILMTIGDVQRAFAVDRPELRHLKNVIVFSTQGKRDLPNM